VTSACHALLEPVFRRIPLPGLRLRKKLIAPGLAVFFERYVLPLLLLQAVRCERCYHRRYVWCTIPTFERDSSGTQATHE
jgi:hypothetical protein